MEFLIFLSPLLVAVIGGVITLRVEKLREENSHQHAVGAAERAAAADFVTEQLRLQDEERANQVAGLAGKLEIIHDDVKYTKRRIDDHVSDRSAHLP